MVPVDVIRKPIVLLTGFPGVGKTTALGRVVERLRHRGLRLSGFHTEAVRVHGERRGFRVTTLDGNEAVLADRAMRGPHGIGRYGVDLAGFEQVVLGLLAPDAGVDLYVVDEIGKMECLSSRFVARMRALLASGAPLLATVARTGTGLIAEVKHRPDAVLMEVTRANRGTVPERVIARLLTP